MTCDATRNIGWNQHYSLCVFLLGEKRKTQNKNKKEKVLGLKYWAGTAENLRGSLHFEVLV